MNIRKSFFEPLLLGCGGAANRGQTVCRARAGQVAERGRQTQRRVNRERPRAHTAPENQGKTRRGKTIPTSRHDFSLGSINYFESKFLINTVHRSRC